MIYDRSTFERDKDNISARALLILQVQNKLLRDG
jgi:hypothetical protein